MLARDLPRNASRASVAIRSACPQGHGSPVLLVLLLRSHSSSNNSHSNTSRHHRYNSRWGGGSSETVGRSSLTIMYGKSFSSPEPLHAAACIEACLIIVYMYTKIRLLYAIMRIMSHLRAIMSEGCTLLSDYNLRKQFPFRN